MLSEGVALAYEFHPADPGGSLQRYQYHVDITGQLSVQGEKQALNSPLQVQAEFTYGERRADDGTSATELRSLRFYEQARAVIRMGKQIAITRLSPAHQLVRGRVSGQKLSLLSPHGPFTREERDLLDVPSDSLAMTGLLPTEAVELKQSWSPRPETLCLLLGLDEVTHPAVQAALIAVEKNIAQIELTGKLTGKVLGAATAIELNGKARFDLKQGTFVDWS